MEHSIWKHVLCFVAVAVSACTVHIPASACDRIKFFNGVNVEINKDKIKSIGALLEQGSGYRIESVNVISPDDRFPGSIVIYPFEDKQVINDGCREMAGHTNICFATLSDRNVWISVRIEEQMNADDMKRAIKLATTYVADEVLCDN